MKKQIVFLLFILFFGKISVAQFYVGADATVVYPFGHLKSQVDFGYGPKFNLGYSLNEKLDLSFSYEFLDFKTMQLDFRMMSETLNFKYKFEMENYIPYVGVKTGLYHSNLAVPGIIIGQSFQNNEKIENAFGIAPMTGVLVNLGNSNNWKLDISTAYSILNFKNKYEYLSLNFGVMYSF